MRNYLLANQHNRRRNVLTVVNRRLHQLRDSVGDGDVSPTSSEWPGGRPPYVSKGKAVEELCDVKTTCV